MPDKDQIWIAAVMLCAALWGGVVSYYRKVTKGMQHTLWRMFLEVLTSAGAGMGAGILCYDGGLSVAWSVAFAGVAGHMGSAVIDIGEDILESTLRAMAGRGGKN